MATYVTQTPKKRCYPSRVGFYPQFGPGVMDRRRYFTGYLEGPCATGVGQFFTGAGSAITSASVAAGKAAQEAAEKAASDPNWGELFGQIASVVGKGVEVGTRGYTQIQQAKAAARAKGVPEYQILEADRLARQVRGGIGVGTVALVIGGLALAYFAMRKRR